MVLRTAIKHISRLGRATLGVRVINLKRDDVVASVAVITSKDKNIPPDTNNQETPGNGEPQALPRAEPGETPANIPGNGQES